jgi:hypothetical protein
MNLHRPFPRQLLVIALILCVPVVLGAGPTPAAVSGFNTYVASVESRLAEQHRSSADFLAPLDAAQQDQLRRGQMVFQKLTPQPGNDLPGALLHHWRGSAFAPGAHAADLEHLLGHYEDYPRLYAPQVLQGKVLSRKSDDLQAFMRVSQRHVITVVLDTWYNVAYGRLDQQHIYTISRSTKIAEVASPGTPSERDLSSEEDHGFLWLMNTYWTFEERDGGLYMQLESVTLTRNIPPGLAWAVRPFIESIPRDSLEFTLSSTLKALQK